MERTSGVASLLKCRRFFKKHYFMSKCFKYMCLDRRTCTVCTHRLAPCTQSYSFAHTVAFALGGTWRFCSNFWRDFDFFFQVFLYNSISWEVSFSHIYILPSLPPKAKGS